MISTILCINSKTNVSENGMSPSSSAEDVLGLIKALRGERAEDIKGKVIDNLGNKRPTANKDRITNGG